MSVKVITVGREFGSGGRSVGKAVAAALGWDYYDQELVRHVAEKTGFAERYIEETGEYSASKSRLAYAFSSVGSPEVMNGLSASDYLWTVQRKVILDLAEKGNCVIVGRCADYILEDRDDVLNVFVCTPVRNTGPSALCCFTAKRISRRPSAWRRRTKSAR